MLPKNQDPMGKRIIDGGSHLVTAQQKKKLK
jgi:hypothetical protein